MDPFDWTKLPTSDGNYGLKRLDMYLKQWKETQKRLRFHTFTIGLIEKEWDILSHGKTSSSSVKLNMIDWNKTGKEASTLQNK